MEDAELYRPRRARIKIRRGVEWEVKPECEAIDGKEITVNHGWKIDEHDSGIYAGEAAMVIQLTSLRELPSDAPAWIASGDLEFLN